MRELENILKNVFNFENFKNVYQKEAIEAILKDEHKNYIINMQTQGGKSLCYQLPGYMKPNGVTIIFSPSPILIRNHHNYLKSLNIRSEIIDGQIEYNIRDEIREEIRDPTSDIRFLFVTPEVAYKNGIMKEFLSEIICDSLVNYIVVDEAHKIVDSTYRESYKLLGCFRSLNKNIPWIALTSINKYLEYKIAEALHMDNPLYLSSPLTRENIVYDVVLDGRVEGHRIIDFINGLKENGKIPSGIIFCNYTYEVRNAVQYLQSVGIKAHSYHRNIGKQFEHFEKWIDGKVSVLVTTGETLGYGINFNIPAVRFVIHLYMPANLRSFYHESGRAGNDGKIGYSRIYKVTEFFMPNKNENHADFKKYVSAPCKQEFLSTFFEDVNDSC